MKKTRNIKNIGGKFYIDFTFRGRRIRRFGGFTLEQAKVALAAARLELRDIELGLKKPPAEDVTFSAFADEFLKLHSKPYKRSWQGDEHMLEDLKKRFRGLTLREITAGKIAGFIAERQAEASKTIGKPLSPATVNRALALLKTMLNKAVEWGRLESSPAAKTKKLRESPGRERVATADEIRRLLEAADPQLRPIIITALGTGMRRGEILRLKWADLDFVRGVITITMSKSGKSRKVPMSGEVAAVLGAVPRRAEFVFWNEETKTHLKDVKAIFRSACARAGIVGLRLHDLRHTFASRALELGADLVSVSEILGHSNIAMMSRYLHASNESRRSAVEQISKYFELNRREK